VLSKNCPQCSVKLRFGTHCYRCGGHSFSA
jgi:hypothetical protein